MSNVVARIMLNELDTFIVSNQYIYQAHGYDFIDRSNGFVENDRTKNLLYAIHVTFGFAEAIKPNLNNRLTRKSDETRSLKIVLYYSEV